MLVNTVLGRKIIEKQCY